MSHQEIQIAPGVYVTDFRQNGTLQGLSQPKKELTNDVGLLLDDCHTIESKSKMLEFTIEEIKKEEGWEEDGDFREAVEDNWAVLIRFCTQLKEKVLKLAELKYQPETTKIEEILNIDRIEMREAHAMKELTSILKAREVVMQKEPIEGEDEGIYL